MDAPPAVMIGFAVVLAVLVLAILLWFFAAIGAWADEAFEKESWIAFGLLLFFTFPGGPIAWLIIRALRTRPASPEAFLHRDHGPTDS